MDLHNRSLIVLFPNAYVTFQVVCGWLQGILGGFGWFRVVSDGFGWFRVVSCFSSYHVSLSFIVLLFFLTLFVSLATTISNIFALFRPSLNTCLFLLLICV